MAGRRVVVTGIGTINPLGHSIEEYFTNLENGVSAATEITLFDATKFRSRMACEVKDYDWSRYFDRKEVRKYDRFAQWAMISADEALRDAGVVDNDLIDKERVGVVWGSGTGGTTTFYEESKGYIEGNYTPRFSPFFVPRMVVDLAAGFISIKYGFMGPNYSTVSACASSNHAMIDALNLIRWGKADMIVTGGSEASINDPGVGSFCGMQALSTRNDDPKHASRPFDKDRDGFVIGEGGGALIFEELEHAKKRGAKIYCEVVGGGMSADAYHMTSPSPEGDAAARAMINAYTEAGLKPEDVDYINAHGTSTGLNDKYETTAIKKAFGDSAAKLKINSTKSMIGHLLGAAGAVEAVVCAKTIEEGFIHKTVGYEVPDEECDLDYCTEGNIQQEVNVALSNSLGFGGHNGTLCFKKIKD